MGRGEWVDQIQEEIGGACSIYGRNGKFPHNFISEQSFRRLRGRLGIYVMDCRKRRGEDTDRTYLAMCRIQEQNELDTAVDLFVNQPTEAQL